jgi:hypothetical protein
MPLRQGDRVEARYRKDRDWSPAMISAIRGEDLFDLEFSNGNFEGDVERIDENGDVVVRRVKSTHMYRYDIVKLLGFRYQQW